MPRVRSNNDIVLLAMNVKSTKSIFEPFLKLSNSNPGRSPAAAGFGGAATKIIASETRQFLKVLQSSLF